MRLPPLAAGLLVCLASCSPREHPVTQQTKEAAPTPQASLVEKPETKVQSPESADGAALLSSESIEAIKELHLHGLREPPHECEVWPLWVMRADYSTQQWQSEDLVKTSMHIALCGIVTRHPEGAEWALRLDLQRARTGEWKPTATE